jgi:nucleoside-diphosphate-sugar epimerase
MKLLITGAAGNLGSFLARHLLNSDMDVGLMYHKTPLSSELRSADNMHPIQADLARPETLPGACAGVDCVVHFAGVLFAPGPEHFLPDTNVQYVRNLVAAALEAGVSRFIIVSFPHVEGESNPDCPARGNPHGDPESAHARTRLQAEQHLFEACEGTKMTPVVLRPGMIYGREILMIAAARWLARHHLLYVWRKPTWIHLLSLPDFLTCVAQAATLETCSGIYNLGDDQPTTLQEFLDMATRHWNCHRPLRLPRWCFFVAAWACETFARLFRTASPLTADFIRIGMVSYTADTSRMKEELLAQLAYPSLNEGLPLL